jgi:hypothetical protein
MVKYIKPNVSPRTRERYEQIATKNICSLIGGKALSKLQAIDIREAYAKALESGRCDGKGGLSPRTVHHMHRVLFSALDQAERWKLIARNPAALLEKRDRPKIERKPVTTIDVATTATVFDAARERRLFIPLVLAALAACAVARLPPCAGRRSTLSSGNCPSSPALSKPMPARSARKRRQGAADRPALSCGRGMAPLARSAGRGTA